MPDEEDEERGFTIVDKRDEDGSEAAAPAEDTTVLPPVDLPSLVISLGTSALFHLGMVPDPQTGQPGEINLDLARHTIGTIELLQEKTQGNLTDDETALFQNLLTELRMRFVEAKSS